jgi:hypothetical protein
VLERFEERCWNAPEMRADIGGRERERKKDKELRQPHYKRRI